jgi:hypothetical protein
MVGELRRGSGAGLRWFEPRHTERMGDASFNEIDSPWGDDCRVREGYVYWQRP